MQKKFVMRGYEMNCEPRVTEDGRFAAQVEVTKLGFSREAAFRSLGEFATEAEAVEYAKNFSVEWLSRYG
ncbi:hypothetical protein WR30_26170 [Burkholderia contaminans FFH2055]|uniref:hypothetical protein n=1 Tax=Burkholderia contaminans TaxID=488447 RepID=UPI0006267923|nr:hypothetical protein [Burkholderia contaminans]KKL34022.1 hypothetical protein WR30_26170 [Burkholderia contaminans FFH2055]MEB4632210.1 hypothetical protein [Burkholderia contaminans]MEB4639641.1 hypothetical protein [Burkholderia contaminans]MEB4654297.1 hypothetical protein [Burkholderia contaminans]MEB4663414.1 hypothetical protein [Burkholderia contaminans]